MHLARAQAVDVGDTASRAAPPAAADGAFTIVSSKLCDNNQTSVLAPCLHSLRTHATVRSLRAHACTIHTHHAFQAPGATPKEVSSAFDKLLWPHRSSSSSDGSSSGGGGSSSSNSESSGGSRTWDSWEEALGDIEAAMKLCGLPRVKKVKHEYWDRETGQLKKLVIKCPHAGEYRGMALADVRVDGGRKTTTDKTNCPFVVNIKAARDGA
jgi:hypothetical protein